MAFRRSTITKSSSSISNGSRSSSCRHSKPRGSKRTKLTHISPDPWRLPLTCWVGCPAGTQGRGEGAERSEMGASGCHKAQRFNPPAFSNTSKRQQNKSPDTSHFQAKPPPPNCKRPSLPPTGTRAEHTRVPHTGHQPACQLGRELHAWAGRPPPLACLGARSPRGWPP